MPSGETARRDHALLAVIGVTLVLRLIVGGLTHLTEDEAYYRLWSLAPAFGYYDHPPMIAWWIWLGRHVVGDTALGARLVPMLASAATSLLVFDMARLAGADGRITVRAGIWFNATLLVIGGGFLAVPDAAASLFWSLTVWCALKARGSPIWWTTAWWAGAGVAAGLATLSKYSALFIAPGMLIWLAWTPQGRAQLKTAGPWLAAAIAAAIFSSNIAWNAQHHWLTFDKQFGRVAAQHFAPWHLAEFAAGQFLLLNPLIALFAVAAVIVRPKPGARRATDLSPFFALSAPFIAYLVIHSLHDRVQAHWPAPLYPLLSICAAAGADRMGQRWRPIRRAAPIVGFAVGVLALIMLAIPGGVLGRFDLAAPVRGWTRFASQLEALRGATGAGWLGTTSYGLASELADAPELRAPVVQIAERDRWQGLALGRPPDLSAPGLVVDLTRRAHAESLRRCFTQVTPLGVITRGDQGETGKPYAVFIVAGPTRDIFAVGC